MVLSCWLQQTYQNIFGPRFRIKCNIHTRRANNTIGCYSKPRSYWRKIMFHPENSFLCIQSVKIFGKCNYKQHGDDATRFIVKSLNTQNCITGCYLLWPKMISPLKVNTQILIWSYRVQYVCKELFVSRPFFFANWILAKCYYDVAVSYDIELNICLCSSEIRSFVTFVCCIMYASLNCRLLKQHAHLLNYIATLICVCSVSGHVL